MKDESEGKGKLEKGALFELRVLVEKRIPDTTSLEAPPLLVQVTRLELEDGDRSPRFPASPTTGHWTLDAGLHGFGFVLGDILRL